ncbi:MAG: cell division protein FtsA, partial [Chitinivibrionales bacterium]
SAMNLNKSVTKAGFEVADLVLEPIASSYSVLGEDEKELGVALVDMGGGTTDIAIYSENSLKYPGVVSLGGENVTKDIAIGIRTPVEKAEEIKKKNGCAFSALVKESEFVNVPGVGGRDNREVSRTALASIIEPRMEEILNIVEREIQNSKYAEMLGAGIVLTGGGAMIEGVQELAEKVFKMPVKVGSPMNFGGLTEAAQTPVHATGVGLCKYAIEQYASGVNMDKKSVGSDFKSILAKMKQWMKEYF